MSTMSFAQLPTRGGVSRIEIPIIQRDYAQGRDDADVSRIRAAFLDALRDAVTGGAAVHLDFVYGEIEGAKLVPLDGQQRLTALFLLHWYLRARCELSETAVAALPQLTYATRSSARRFCQLLIEQHALPLSSGEMPSDWLRDQSWFVLAWRHDPTIESMLVVLDAIHERLAGADCAQAWERLLDDSAPAITFQFLVIRDLGLTDDLYIKMNSRGKPLTPFENFKAQFEKLVGDSAPARHEELCRKIDNDWSDVFWSVRGGDDLIDDEFMRYFRFVTDVLTHRTGKTASGDDLSRAINLFGGENSERESNLTFLFRALDAWHGKDIPAWFEDAFTRSTYEAGKVAIYEPTDLFGACCASYPDARAFPFRKVLLLYAVTVHLTQETELHRRRLRVLRNLILNSADEVRPETRAPMLCEVAAIMTDGSIPDSSSFNRRQAAEERTKAQMIASDGAIEPTLARLEDHPLLRGSLPAFDLGDPTFAQNSETFLEVFSGPGGLPSVVAERALLACGDYSQRTRQGKIQFGCRRTDVWSTLLTSGGHSDLPKLRRVLATLFVRLRADSSGTLDERLRRIAAAFVTESEAKGALDWRYYLVKYDEMRSGGSGLYAPSSGTTMGFSMRMLSKTRLSGWHCDPYLFAIRERVDASLRTAIEEPWVYGWAHQTPMKLLRSGIGVLGAAGGFVIRGPTVEKCGTEFERIAKKYNATGDGLVAVKQAQGVLSDAEDRVKLGVALVSELAAIRPV